MSEKPTLRRSLSIRDLVVYGIIFCVLKRAQVAYLKKKLKKIDPRAFITVNDAYEVLGKGFEREEY